MSPLTSRLVRPLRLVLLAGLSALSLSVLPSAGEAQQELGTCRVLPGTSRVVGRTAAGARVFYVSRPRLSCEGGIRINADSMVSFEATGFNRLIGNVYFEDQTRVLLSREARYFDQVGRLEATGEVELTDKDSGNEVEGENLLYLRATQQANRDEEELTVWGGRSRALLYPSGSDADSPSPPYDVLADRIFIQGESYFRATGSVEVTRDSLDASADTLEYVQDRERLFLTGQARVDQTRFDLTGREILILLPGDTIRSVEARGEARLVGDELELDAPFIRMGFTGGTVDALWAVPFRPGQRLEGARADRLLPTELDSLQLERPFARSTDFEMVADSLEVQAPGEVLQRLFAAGSARAVSSARDSLNTEDTPDLIRRDWIEGDTVVAFFADSTPPGSDSTQYVLERLEARVGARSLYRIEPDSAEAAPVDSMATDSLDLPAGQGAETDSTTAPDSGDFAPVSDTLPSPDPVLAVHYVIAEQIIIVFQDGEVQRMEVKGLEQGLYLDPAARRRRRSTEGGRP